MGGCVVLSAALVAACGGGAASTAEGGATTSVTVAPSVTSTTPTTSPSSAGWIECARENGTCAFSGTRSVKYGVDSSTVVGTFTDLVACDNTTFGDPAVGQVKTCWYDSSSTSASTVPSTNGTTITPAVATTSGPTTTVSLSGTTADFQNPERGFYVEAKDSELTAATLNSFANTYNTRLFLYQADIGAYRSQPLPASYLTALGTQFAGVRSAGAKLILRFIYDGSAAGVDAPLSMVQQHLSQLKPVLAANADVIAYMQAGLIGAWGEGWSSTNGLNTPEGKAGVRDALLGAVPGNLAVAFQNVDVQAWGGMARISAKNDCQMASDDDEYNFPGGLTSPLRAYIHDHNDNSPYGGETCAGSNPRRSCAAILSEGPYYHLTYLNAAYDTAFMNQWKAEGCYAEVSRSIGYRLQLDQVNHPTTVSKGSTVNVAVTVRNVGWSRIFSKRPLVVTLRNKSSGALVTGTAGNLNDVAAGASVTINVPVTLSDAGNYEVSIGAPDIYKTTATDTRQAVRFANADNASSGQAWDATNARFVVGSTLTVQ